MGRVRKKEEREFFNSSLKNTLAAKFQTPLS
jgi:hypothetical protein